MTSYTGSMESRSDANFMQSRGCIPRDSYSNKIGLDKLNICKTSQVNLDKEPTMETGLSLKDANALENTRKRTCTSQIIQNGPIICVISSKLQCGTSEQTRRKLLS